MKSSVNCVASLSLRTLLLIVKFLIFSVYHIGNFTHVLFSTFVTISEDVPPWALAPLMKANVKIKNNDRKQILLTICLFQVIADGFYFFRFPRVASMSSENQDLRHHRSDALRCAYPWAAASPTCQGIPTLRITARFPFSAPAPSRPRRLLSRLAGL